jgi:hypothetical protein
VSEMQPDNPQTPSCLDIYIFFLLLFTKYHHAVSICMHSLEPSRLLRLNPPVTVVLSSLPSFLFLFILHRLGYHKVFRYTVERE